MGCFKFYRCFNNFNFLTCSDRHRALYLIRSRNLVLLNSQICCQYCCVSVEFPLVPFSRRRLLAPPPNQLLCLFPRLDFVKSKLSFQALSDSNKTTNLSCEAFRAHDIRFGGHCQGEAPSSVFTTVLGAMEPNPQSTKAMVPSLLQFELFQRYFKNVYL